jgi:hypothetical protein
MCWSTAPDPGTTPASLELAPGPHQLTLQAPARSPRSSRLTSARRREARRSPVAGLPVVRALRPALHGAQIADATFLADGRLGLVVSLPGDERQAWTLDPSRHFRIDRLGTSCDAPLGRLTAMCGSPSLVRRATTGND